MEKNFLNITPESGKGNQEVTINAKANISLEDREASEDYSGSWYDLLPYYASIWHPGRTR